MKLNKWLKVVVIIFLSLMTIVMLSGSLFLLGSK